MSERKVAILGGGRIGEALLSGLLSSGWRDPSEVVVTNRRDERNAELKERYGAEATTDNEAAGPWPTRATAPACWVAGGVAIAVKPQDIDVLLGEIGVHLTTEQTLVSVAAAIPTAHIEERIADGIPVVRAMPNAPATVHEGMAGICAGAHAEDEQLALAEELLSHLGRVVRVPEAWLEGVTAVSGSGPAYFALLAEAMIEAGILLGLSREV